MKLVALPAFSDNYIWLLHDGEQAVVVDPGEAGPVERALDELGLALAAILVTHHHGDHTGGVATLRARLNGPVFAPAAERIEPPRVPLASGDEITVLGVRWRVIDVPGHTAGHIAYVGDVPGVGPVLFCGDTLFSAGCGRLFEGTPAQMHASLSRLAELPADTRVCCAHEYTLANLRFARAVEPANPVLAAHQAHCLRLRDQDQPTLPSTLGMERQINPFLRCTEPAVRAAAQARGADPADPVAVFAAIRGWKDQFQ